MTAQAIQLSFFPRVLVRHTSKESEGQIYLPLLNVGLAVACILLVLVFRSSSRLAAAFGLAVSGTMLISSVVFWVVTRHTWGWSPLKAGALLVLFLSFDIPFVVANAMKFFDGGYLPFLVGVFFVVVMSTWRAGRGLLADILRARGSTMDALRVKLAVAHRIPGLGVFMASSADTAPPVLTTVLERFCAAHERIVLLTVVTEHVPDVPAGERAQVADLGDGLVRVVLRFGFTEEPDVPRGLARAFEALGWDAAQGEVRYFLGRETLIATNRGRMGRRREAFFAWMSRNARSATDHFRLPPDQVTEIGSQLDL
jgi:KUP system potassium uptake protein